MNLTPQRREALQGLKDEGHSAFWGYGDYPTRAVNDLLRARYAAQDPETGHWHITVEGRTALDG